jgi:CRP/FNR family transcriptional regulator, cyclic AMP receptor protein
MFVTKKIAPNEFLLKEGDRSFSMYWVQSGHLEVTKRKGDEYIVLGNIFGGELVGEISFLDEEPRSATVKAITETELIEIRRESFEKIFSGQPKWLEILVKTLAERLRKANSRIKV